ncbi:tetratricopeptide repeat protein, partial [Flavobacterium daejeonense]|uniref:tetratricopeptide repeat protein n=1 Tax=Flavobacterium daejeonense TaxID=350893 RepID=UPI00047C2E3F
MKNSLKIIALLLSLQLWAQNSGKPSVSTMDMARMQLNPNHFYYNPEKGFESCKKAAEEEANPKAMNMLAILYSDGVGTEVNQEQALNWFKKAAESGYVKAWYNVGIMYKDGIGTPQDFEKAFEYYSKGTELKAISSMGGKGYLLFKGLGCQQNYEEAFELFKVASQYGNLNSMYMLGICYRNGYGTTKDVATAREWMTKAANYGYKPAQNEMMEAEPEFTDYKETQKTDSKSKEIHEKAIKETFQSVSHRLKSTEKLDGTYTGYLVTYDWSGQHIIAKEALTVEL